MGAVFLQIFLYANVFVIGVLAAVALRHARAHFSRAEKEPAKKTADVRIPNAVREELIHEAETRFRLATNANAKLLEDELAVTAKAMAAEMKKLGDETVQRQRAAQEEARADVERTADEAVRSARQVLTSGGDELKKVSDAAMAKLDAELKTLADERSARIAADIDAKLSDAVVSFLLETLGHDVDLGAQMKYVLGRLEENKAAIKAEVRS